jgi:hypothetical protein
MCVFAPVGMAVTLAEELPEFVDKGRQRVQVQLGNAKIVGRYVVTRGQRQLSDRIGDVLNGMNDDEVDDDEVVVGSGVSVTDTSSGVADNAPRDWGRDRDNAARDRMTSYAPSPSPSSSQSPPDPAAAAIVEGALADYDTLSASQVVRRLESLGPEELHAVQRYEASTRNRRTILNRASQLLEEGPAAAAAE